MPEAAGDYVDALKNKKARVHLLGHETLGGMQPYAAMRLRRLGRAAAALGNDPTDYSISYTANDYVSYYAQRISNACVMNTARSTIDALAVLRNKRRKASAPAV